MKLYIVKQVTGSELKDGDKTTEMGVIVACKELNTGLYKDTVFYVIITPFQAVKMLLNFNQ